MAKHCAIGPRDVPWCPEAGDNLWLARRTRVAKRPSGARFAVHRGEQPYTFSAANTRSGVNGECRSRMPLSCVTAFDAFSEAQVRELEARAEKLARKTAPFPIETRPKAHWIEPVLLADVEYRRMTKKPELLRHPSYKGLRKDLMD